MTYAAAARQLHKSRAGIWRCEWCGLGYLKKGSAVSHVRAKHPAVVAANTNPVYPYDHAED